MITTALGFITSRKWIMELILLAMIVGGVWWFCSHLIDVGVQRQKDADAVELARVTAAARVHEAQIAKESSDAYEVKLAAIRSSTPIGSVRLCHSPTVPSPTSAPGHPDEPTTGREQGATEEDPGPDIGPAINAYSGDCAAVAAQLESLQGWVRAR